MAAELITPTDELTGLPLPILPQEYLQANATETNWHHAWHANSAPELQGLGGRALRHSRVQLVHRTDHNYKDKGRPNYHNFFEGPPLPDNEDDQFRLCVISAAGYIPDTAIDLRSGEPELVVMSEDELDILRAPANPRPLRNDEKARVRQQAADGFRKSKQSGSRRKHTDTVVATYAAKRQKQASFGFHHLIYQYEPMRDFFREYVLTQDVDSVRESEVEEFLMTPDQQRKHDLGKRFLKLAINQTTDFVEGPYQELRRAGKLHPGMPPQARSLVFYKLGNEAERADLALRQAQILRDKLGLAA